MELCPFCAESIQDAVIKSKQLRQHVDRRASAHHVPPPCERGFQQYEDSQRDASLLAGLLFLHITPATFANRSKQVYSSAVSLS
jgi:hypothetical protein